MWFFYDFILSWENRFKFLIFSLFNFLWSHTVAIYENLWVSQPGTQIFSIKAHTKAMLMIPIPNESVNQYCATIIPTENQDFGTDI